MGKERNELIEYCCLFQVFFWTFYSEQGARALRHSWRVSSFTEITLFSNKWVEIFGAEGVL